MTSVQSTIIHLHRCILARVAGYPVSFTTDPTWLVHQAINRRAGWPDDPSHSRGSAMPISTRIRCTLIRASRYPPKAMGDLYAHLKLIAREVNTPRLRVHRQRLGEWETYLLRRIPERFAVEEE